MAGLTRGPLKAEVYWRRRLVVLAVALLLVLGVARVLGQGSDASDGRSPQADATAAQAGAGTTPGATASGSAEATPPAPTPSTRKEKRQARREARRAAEAAAAEAAAKAAAQAAAALPEPQGACADNDVAVTPSVPAPVAGGDVVVDLDVRTRFSVACTWTVSPDTLALKVTSGPDDIWSTQDCPGVVPTQDVVLRHAVGTPLQVTWNGRRSDDGCTGRTDWALPGFYHVMASALAGEPSDVQFEMTTPSAPTVTRTAKPQTKAGKKLAKQQQQAQQEAQQEAQQQAEQQAEQQAQQPAPSGAVEPTPTP